MKKLYFTYVFIIIGLMAPGYLHAIDIEEIRFHQQSFLDESDIEEIITSESGDEFDARMIKLDKILLTNFYKRNGFLDIFISDSISFTANRENVNIDLYVDEGRRYYYGGSRFSGTKDIPLSTLRAIFIELEKNTPFDESLITEAVKQVENTYYNSGKPFVNIDVNYAFEDDSLVFVQIDITENQTVYINDIRYIGLDLVQEFLIRRELEIGKGQKYRRDALDKSQKNIYGTGLFKFVRFELEPQQDNPEQVTLNILVEEKDAYWVGARIGLAYEEVKSYGNKIEFTLQGGHRNLFGTARSVSLHLTPAFVFDFNNFQFKNVENRLMFRFVEPWIAYTRTPGVLQLSYEQHRPLNSGNFDLINSSFYVRNKISDDMEISGTIAAKFVNRVSGQEIDSSLAEIYDTDKNNIYSLTAFWKNDDRKNIFFPTNSAYTDLSLTFSLSDGVDEFSQPQRNQYFTFVSSWQLYQPYRPQVLTFSRWDFTLASRLKVGAIFEPWENKAIPINDRFYAGGATTVRGYQERLLGPAAQTDENGKISKAAGGKLLFLGNIEVRMPIVWLLVLETFIDSGNVWAELNDFSPAEIRFTAGAGLAVLTPLGPIRVDYGYKLTRRSIDPDPDAFHLGIYFAF